MKTQRYNVMGRSKAIILCRSLLVLLVLFLFVSTAEAAYLYGHINLHPDQKLPSGWQWKVRWYNSFQAPTSGDGPSGIDSTPLYFYAYNTDTDLSHYDIRVNLYKGSTSVWTYKQKLGQDFHIYTTASLGGTISYSGSQTGQVRLKATNEDFGQDLVVSSIGSYSFSALQRYVPYTFTAYIDSNANSVQDTWEAFGSFGSTVTLSSDKSGQNFTLHDPTIDSDNDDSTDYYEHYVSLTDPYDSDTDDDEMPDGWEINNNLNPLLANAIADPDFDFLSNLGEYQHGSDPYDRDSDDDGLTDGEEVNTYNSSPIDTDTDDDGISDYDEVTTHGTDPTLSDTDEDGVNDGIELGAGTDPLDRLSFPTDIFAGIVTYDGPQTGAIYVAASVSSNAWQSPYYTTIANPKEYLVEGVPTLNHYWAKAYCDSNSNFSNDFWEAKGVYELNSVYVTDDISGIDIELTDPDTDDDSISDWWEIENFTNGVEIIGSDDPDSDGLDNLGEWQHKTDPNKSDSDADGLTDGVEVNTHNTDPNNSDSDNDGLTDEAEVNTHNTDPKNPDSDADGLTDGAEVNTHSTDPKNADSDADGLTDGAEVNTYNTDPKDSDSDNDGLSDGAEVNTHNTDPKDSDSDNDGLTDGAEVNTHNTDPNNSDSDNDGLTDGNEVTVYETNPIDADTDNDGMPDGWEITFALNPKFDDASIDVENDGLSNLVEYQNGSDPHDEDTDDDGLNDGYEVVLYGTDPADPDSDDDSLSDYDEINTYGTNPNNADSDGDGANDKSELIAGTSPVNQQDVFKINSGNVVTNDERMIIYWNSVNGRLYSVYSNTNLLSAWPTSPLFQIQGDGTLKCYTNTESGSPRFFKLSVELNP